MKVLDFTDVALADLLALDGRVAVVTGGAAGIGAAIGARLAEAGATTVIADLDVDEAGHVAETIASGGGNARAVRLDVTDTTATEALAADLTAAHGRLDIWVNNAGIYPSRPFLDMTDDDWNRVIDVNLNGAFRGSRAAARQMTEQGRGVIVNVASVSGFRGRRGLSHYSTSKHGLRGLTRSLAVELGPLGIRAVGLAPTMTITPGTSAAAGAAPPRAANERHDTGVYAQLPLGRAAVPDDIARVALFCVSDLAALVTGVTIAVDAGQMSM